MKRLFVSAVLSVVAVLGLTLNSEAGHGKFRHQSGCDSGYAYAAPCETVAYAPAPVQYVEQKVTRYKQVMVEKEIEEVVYRQVARQEKFTYSVQVPVTKQEVRKQTYYTQVQKEVPYTYTVCVPVTVAEKRKETIYNRVEKQVPYTYTVAVPRTVQKKVTQTTYQCINENVTETVPVCRTVRVSCVDECGRCYTRCERVTEMVPVTRCIVKRVPITQEVVVNHVICEYENRQGSRTVCELVPVVRDVVVNVCRIENQTRQATRTVCEVVPQVRDVTIQVCSYATEQREGSRTVYNTVNEKVKRRVQYCQMQPYEEIVRVAVGNYCEAPSYNYCDYGNSGGHGRRGHRCGR